MLIHKLDITYTEKGLLYFPVIGFALRNASSTDTARDCSNPNMSYIRVEESQRPRSVEVALPKQDFNPRRPQYVTRPRNGKYIPSLYHNPDKDLSRKIRSFLRKPPLNSQEYFDGKWRRCRSEPSIGNSRERDEADIVPRAQTSADEKYKKLVHLLPERRNIRSAILPPISSGCTRNFNSRYASPVPQPTIDGSVDAMDQLQFCQYLRPTPERTIERESSPETRHFPI